MALKVKVLPSHENPVLLDPQTFPVAVCMSCRSTSYSAGPWIEPWKRFKKFRFILNWFWKFFWNLTEIQTTRTVEPESHHKNPAVHYKSDPVARAWVAPPGLNVLEPGDCHLVACHAAPWYVEEPDIGFWIHLQRNVQTGCVSNLKIFVDCFIQNNCQDLR